ncbi:MAG: YdcF family protein [Bryobacteraceae bacterium]
MRRWLWIAAAAGLLLAARTAWLTVEIRRQGQMEEARPADVIIVLGAAEYRGRPSPVLRARLDHALDLYRRRIAPRILTTGGSGGDPVFTEGDVGRAYLMKNGVAPEAILVEPEGETTMQTAAATAEIMHRMNLRSCVVVSDGYHIFRVKRILEGLGVQAYGSPRPWVTRNNLAQWWLCGRQAAAYMLWSVGVKI